MMSGKKARRGETRSFIHPLYPPAPLPPSPTAGATVSQAGIPDQVFHPRILYLYSVLRSIGDSPAADRETLRAPAPVPSGQDPASSTANCIHTLRNRRLGQVASLQSRWVKITQHFDMRGIHQSNSKYLHVPTLLQSTLILRRWTLIFRPPIGLASLL